MLYFGTFCLSLCIFLCFNNVILLPWWMSLCCCDCCFLLWFPAFTVCHYLCVYLCACMSKDKRLMDIAMCFLLYSGVFASVHISGEICVFRSSPDWSSIPTCRDLLRAAQGYFWSVALLWDRLQKELPLRNQYIFFLFRVWVAGFAISRPSANSLFMYSYINIQHWSSAGWNWKNNQVVITNTC